MTSSSDSSNPTAEFAEQFKASFRTFWLVAVAIVRDHALAEDVVQEAAIVALRKLDQFQPGTSCKAWMSTIVRFVALNHARKERRRRASLLDHQQSAALPPPAEQPNLHLLSSGAVRLNEDLFDDQIVRALGTIGDTARACLLLRSIEGLKYGEIAEVLGLPKGTAMSHVHRSRQLLREKLAGLSPPEPRRRRARA